MSPLTNFVMVAVDASTLSLLMDFGDSVIDRLLLLLLLLLVGDSALTDVDNGGDDGGGDDVDRCAGSSFGVDGVDGNCKTISGVEMVVVDSE